MKLVPGILLFFYLSVSANSNQKDVYNQMKKALEEYRDTGTKPSYLESAAKKYNQPNYFVSPTGTFNKEEICTTCLLVTERLVYDRLHGMNSSEFEKEILYFFKLYGGKTERVSEGLVKLNAPIFLYIIDNTPEFNGSDFCGVFLQASECPRSSRFDWIVDIPEKKSVIRDEVSQKSTESFNILHISDIHFDPRYTPNKTTNCGEPICCQDDQPNAKSVEDTCGYWSAYIKADNPWRSVVAALEKTKKHEYDFVYFTGDMIHHRLWSTNEADNVKIFTKILDAFNEYYKVPVFVVLGNHEAHPSNQYSEVKNPLYSGQWMYDILFQKLSKWFSINEIKDTVLKGGYYSVSPRKGFRVIVLNNNVCNLVNWWLLYNPRDPYNQLKWLTETLLEAENNNEKVHLLYHMVTGKDDFYKTWAREFRKIVERFSDTITAQFNGHTHKDEFYIYYNTSNLNQAINVVWNGGSVVPYERSNPSYKILSIDNKTFELQDFEEWTYNLTKANLNKNIEWYKLYSFKNAFGVKSLKAQEINNLITKMIDEPKILDQYYRYKFRESDVALSAGCDDDCKKTLLCTMVQNEYGVDEVCNRVKKLYNEKNFKK